MLKKNFPIWFLCVLILCLFISGPVGAADVSSSQKSYTIVINPGHSSVPLSGSEPIAPGSSTMKAKGVYGATGAFTKVLEYNTTVSIGLALKSELERRGYHVVMTKTTAKETLSNIERAEIGNQNNADLVISIHADAADSSSAKGASMLVPHASRVDSSIYEASKNYGKIIIDSYAAKTGINNRGLSYCDDIVGFNWTKVPSVLIETGFLTNANDDYYVSNVKNHPAMASAIADGIDLCFPYEGLCPDIRGHWAEKEITSFIDSGYVVGYPSGKFLPENSISRAEFVRIFVAYFGLTGEGESTFSDIGENYWAKDEIDAAVSNGVCEGKGNNLFAPNDPITRQEAATMIANYKKIADTNYDKIAAFSDGSAVADWAKDGVEGVLEAGYIQGYPGKILGPANNISRAETVSLLSRIGK